MLTSRIPENIWKFITQQHVVTITTVAAGDIWSACLFYATYDAKQHLYVLTEETTRHGRLMVENDIVSGTIHNNTREVKQIQGVQFKGVITRLEAAEATTGCQCYQQQFPIASSLPSHPIWKIVPTEVKFTDNTVVFGSKYYWKQE